MAYKMYDKKDLGFKNGYIVKDDVIVPCSPFFVGTINKLDKAMQLVDYVESNNISFDEPGDHLADFHVKSAYDAASYELDLPETPIKDRIVKEGLERCAEANARADVEKINEIIGKYREVTDWCDQDYLIYDTHHCITGSRFDTPFIGNPLDLSGDDIVNMIKRAYTASKHIPDYAVRKFLSDVM